MPRTERPLCRARGTRARALALGLALAAGCGPSNGNPTDDCRGAFVPGDLVITEVMANPLGDDAGNEWFELYNARAENVDLTGLELVAARADGTDSKSHVVELPSPLGPGIYFVLGNALPDLTPEWVHYGYGSGLGELRNSAGGTLRLECEGVVVDGIVFDEMDDGVAWGFDGARAPDYLGNDDLTAWCPATVEFAIEQLGSPGAANQACDGPVTTTCLDGGAPRDLVVPAVGDLVINEIMADPSKAGDATAEWFEVLVTRDVDLNGVELGTTPGTVRGTVTSEECLRVAAGSYVVFGRSTDTTLNGGLPRVDHLFDFGLTNSAGVLYVGVGGVVLDQVTWASTKAGKANALDPDEATAAGNDSPSAWCLATDAYGLGDLGTPGAANPQCPTVVPEGSCLDDDGVTVRPIVPLTMDQVVITEFMANPAAVGDTEGEYIEVLVKADVDLNGLELGTASKVLSTGVVTTSLETTVQSTSCLEVGGGITPRHVLFVRNPEPTLNGGLPEALYVFDFSLANSATAGTAKGIYVGIGGTVLDQIFYTATTSAYSESLDPDFSNPADNDVDANWCDALAADTYGAGDHGTPGAPNSQCP